MPGPIIALIDEGRPEGQVTLGHQMVERARDGRTQTSTRMEASLAGRAPASGAA
jgi:hypothetical protein